MTELKYLKQDKKIPGKETFVTYVDYQVDEGAADMWLYDIFPGVQLMVVDFAIESCFRGSEKENVIGIMILSILVDTFISKKLIPTLAASVIHSIFVA